VCTPAPQPSPLPQDHAGLARLYPEERSGHRGRRHGCHTGFAEFASRTREARSVPGLDELTPREHEVVALIAQGLSNEEISKKIYVSPSTAKTHANRAMTKLGARDRAQLVVFAYQAGLVRPGWA
jgi:DNA-binding NarL/FixJ family response regulator